MSGEGAQAPLAHTHHVVAARAARGHRRTSGGDNTTASRATYTAGTTWKHTTATAASGMAPADYSISALFSRMHRPGNGAHDGIARAAARRLGAQGQLLRLWIIDIVRGRRASR